MHDNNEVNIIAEYNWLYDIINPLKHVKLKNSYYQPILYGCINKFMVKARFIFPNNIG